MEINAQAVIQVLRRKLSDSEFENALLNAQVEELNAQRAAAQSGETTATEGEVIGGS